MPELKDFPIRVNDINNETLKLIIDGIRLYQKDLFPYTPVKDLPIALGGEITVMNILFSVFAELDEMIPDEAQQPFTIENNQFYLMFRKF